MYFSEYLWMAGAIELQVERDRAGDAAQGQLAIDATMVFVLLGHLQAAEAHVRVPWPPSNQSDLEQFAIPGFVVEIERSDADGHVVAGLRPVVAIEAESAAQIVELAFDLKPRWLTRNCTCECTVSSDTSAAEADRLRTARAGRAAGFSWVRTLPRMPSGAIDPRRNSPWRICKPGIVGACGPC